MSWIAKKIPDEKYFSIGRIDPKASNELVASASFLKEVFKFGLYPVLMGEETFGDEPSEYMKIGTALHCHILENSEFDKRYYISKVVDLEEERELLSESDYSTIKRISKKASSFFPEDTNGLTAEIALIGNNEGVPVKCKFDKINVKRSDDGYYSHVEITDVKKIWYDPYDLYRHQSGDRKGLKRKLLDLHYDLQAYFYLTMCRKWLDDIKQFNCSISFSFLLCSLESEKVMKVTAGDDFLESGRQKFDVVWEDVSKFVSTGEYRTQETI